MHIERKKTYTLISSDENSFADFYTSFLNHEQELKKEHLIVQLSNSFNITKEDFSLLLSISASKKESGISFVIISTSANIDDFPEHFNITPTLQEARDILEMEAMERELGF
jgi:hypothetical protein